MASGVMTSGRYSNNYDKRFREIFQDAYVERTPEYSMCAKVENFGENFVKEGDMAALGTMPFVGEGSGGSLDAFTQGNNKTVYFKEYKSNVQITEVTKEDDLSGMMDKIPAKLGSSAAYTIEYLFWDQFNNGFTGSILGLDGKNLFATDHPYVDYGTATQNNEATNSFSYSSVQVMYEHFHSLKNERGLPINMMANKVVIPYQLKWTAEEIFGAGAMLKPGTADNDINVVQALHGDTRYMVSHYLTSATTWFGLSDEHDIRWIWRRPVAIKNWDDENTGNMVYQAKFRAVGTHFHWRGAYGSIGA